MPENQTPEPEVVLQKWRELTLTGLDKVERTYTSPVTKGGGPLQSTEEEEADWYHGPNLCGPPLTLALDALWEGNFASAFKIKRAMKTNVLRSDLM